MDSSPNQNKANKQRGQIIVEYVLLLMVGVAIAAIITRTMVSRSASNPGFLIKKWREIICVIGQDDIEEPTDDASSRCQQ